MAAGPFGGHRIRHVAAQTPRGSPSLARPAAVLIAPSTPNTARIQGHHERPIFYISAEEYETLTPAHPFELDGPEGKHALVKRMEVGRASTWVTAPDAELWAPCIP